MFALIVWVLYLITYSPYSKMPVSGPFASYADCLSVANSSRPPIGQRFECESQYQAGR